MERRTLIWKSSIISQLESNGWQTMQFYQLVRKSYRRPRLREMTWRATVGIWRLKHFSASSRSEIETVMKNTGWIVSFDGSCLLLPLRESIDYRCSRICICLREQRRSRNKFRMWRVDVSVIRPGQDSFGNLLCFRGHTQLPEVMFVRHH